MSKFQIIMQVMLGPKHLSPGRTRHAIVDVRGQREFPAFVRLEIANTRETPGTIYCISVKMGKLLIRTTTR
jgi:hypothetical protein